MSACPPSCTADRKFCRNAKFNVPFYPIQRHSCNLKKPSVHFLLFAHYPWFPNTHGQASPSVINLFCFPRATASHASSLALQLSLQRLCPEGRQEFGQDLSNWRYVQYTNICYILSYIIYIFFPLLCQELPGTPPSGLSSGEAAWVSSHRMQTGF